MQEQAAIYLCDNLRRKVTNETSARSSLIGICGVDVRLCFASREKGVSRMNAGCEFEGQRIKLERVYSDTIKS